MKYSDFKVENNMVDTGKGYKIKPHLSPDEIVTIAQNMLDEKDYMTRQMIKGIFLVHFCTDIDVKIEDGNIVVEKDVYERLNQNGVINDVENTINEMDLWMIDDYINYEESTTKVIKDFCDNVNEKIDKYSDKINTENIIKTLKELNDNGNTKRFTA